jgi:bifunctional UDP-N-acetylglucosamine pyrophosphorylase/glucosamine-1-phosphate N-acetyltransferase
MIVPIVLAAGRSTRFKDEKTKLLHQLGEIEILKRVAMNLERAGLRGIRVVVGHQREDVMKALGDTYEYIVQPAQRGTGDAVKACRGKIRNHYDDVLVVFGDKPLFRPQTIRELIKAHKGIVTIATVEHPTPEQYSEGYGTVLRYDGKILALRKIEGTTECDAALYLFNAKWLWMNLDYLENHRGEYFLPDMVEIASRQGLKIGEYRVSNYRETTGINTKEQFQEALGYLEQMGSD